MSTWNSLLYPQQPCLQEGLKAWKVTQQLVAVDTPVQKGQLQVEELLQFKDSQLEHRLVTVKIHLEQLIVSECFT